MLGDWLEVSHEPTPSDVSPRGSPLKAWRELESPLRGGSLSGLASGAGCQGSQFPPVWSFPAAQEVFAQPSAGNLQSIDLKALPQGSERRQKLQRH